MTLRVSSIEGGYKLGSLMPLKLAACIRGILDTDHILVANNQTRYRSSMVDGANELRRKINRT